MNTPGFTAECAISNSDSHFRARPPDRPGDGVTMALFCDIQAGWRYCLGVGGKCVCTPPGKPCIACQQPPPCCPKGCHGTCPA
jgi:hypothetical protein